MFNYNMYTYIAKQTKCALCMLNKRGEFRYCRHCERIHIVIYAVCVCVSNLIDKFPTNPYSFKTRANNNALQLR